MPRIRDAARHVEVLCRLPLTELALLKGFVELLHMVVPSKWNVGGTFLESGRPGPGYGEFFGYAAMAARWQLECAARFSENVTVEAMQKDPKVGQTLALQRPGFESSDVYLKVFKPFGVKWFLDIPLADEHGVLAGMMLLRGPDERRFNADDCARLDELRPAMARGLRRSRSAPALGGGAVALAPNASLRGYMQTMAEGQLGAATPGARLIMEMLAVGSCPLADFPARAASCLDEIHRDLVAVAARNGGDGAEVVRSNGLGGFRFAASGSGGCLPRGIPEAYETLPRAGPAELHTSIFLEYREPLVLHLARALRHAGLTPAQVHVGVLLASGSTQPEIAEALDVKRSTVDDAVRKIYGRLDVHSVIELAWRLVGAPTSVS